MLRTETRNPNTYDIDKMSTMDILKTINSENNNVIIAVNNALPEIEEACDAAAEAIQQGGRVFYLGAGTSGRLAVCDASEAPPTFGVPYEMFTAILAGGVECMAQAGESAEDDPMASVVELKNHNLSERDIVIGVSASGSAAFVIAGIEYAKTIGAKTVSITNNPNVTMGGADICICCDTGPEVITGSTRMKAGTAQKIILNMISTASMVKCGYVYQNMMINLQPTNKKLKARMVGIVTEILGCNRETAEERLEKANWVIRKAVEE